MGRPTYFRIERLLEALESSRAGMTLEAMAAELAVVPRSVQRYLRDLERQGWVEPAEADPARRKRWRARSEARRRIPLSVSPSELLAQRLALQCTEPVLAGTELESALATVTAKVEAAMPPALRPLATTARSAFPVVAKPGRGVRPGPEVIEDVVQAYLERRVLEAEYRALSHGGAVKSYRLRPVALFHHRGALYLGALGGDDGAVRRFALDRFVSVTLTKERFTLPTGFSEKSFVEQPFGVFDGEPERVRVRFSAEVAAGVRERVWHPTQQLRELSDGRLEVTIRASGWPEIRAWILSYGIYAELLEPAARRAELRAELRAMAKAYR